MGLALKYPVTIAVVCLTAVMLGLGTVRFALDYGQNTVQAISMIPSDISRWTGFHVEDVEIQGRRNADLMGIMQTLGIKRGEILYAVNISAARQRLRSLDWIEDAVIKRRFPSHLTVRLKERVPAAVWQNDGQFFVVDMSGAIVQVGNVSSWSHLPQVVGTGATDDLPTLQLLLDESMELRSEIDSMVRVGQRRWDIHLKNGLIVQLPANKPLEGWLQFLEIQRTHDVLARPLRIIDLRLPDRITVRLTDEGVKLTRASGQES